MDLNLPVPAAYYYRGKWSADCNDALVKCLITLKSEIKWTLKHFPSWFLLTAQRKIDRHVGEFFSEAELSQRVELLHRRYKTFKVVVGYHAAYWDMPNKYVRASDDLWHKIIKKNEFAGAYYYHDEPIYPSLACLFGMDDVKVEGEMDVIDISDNTAKIPSEDTVAVDIDDNDEEVNSPAVFRRPAVKRKLFADEDIPADMESITHTGIHFIDLEADGQPRTRIDNSRALPKPTTVVGAEGDPFTKSPHTSSCASNSPIGWLRKLRQ